MRSWREAAERIQAASSELTADRRAKMEATVAQMKLDASAAEANFQKLTKAGAKSWTALSAALAESEGMSGWRRRRDGQASSESSCRRMPVMTRMTLHWEWRARRNCTVVNAKAALTS
jgi:hypothetical protein